MFVLRYVRSSSRPMALKVPHRSSSEGARDHTTVDDIVNRSAFLEAITDLLYEP